MAKRQAIDEIEEVEGEEEAEAGGGLELGLVLATTLALIAGLAVGFKELGLHYGIGPFAG
ncbi:MAG: hypothetical protein V2A76_01115 [Planctomycetota bacterium]